MRTVSVAFCNCAIYQHVIIIESPFSIAAEAKRNMAITGRPLALPARVNLGAGGTIFDFPRKFLDFPRKFRNFRREFRNGVRACAAAGRSESAAGIDLACIFSSVHHPLTPFTPVLPISAFSPYCVFCCSSAAIHLW